MSGGMSRIFTHPHAGPVASLVAAVLAVALGATLLRSNAQESFLRARIAALAAHDASQLQAQLTSCHATLRGYADQAVVAREAAAAPRVDLISASGDRRKLAALLVGTPPAGIDVCARMENADQAVMKALDRK